MGTKCLIISTATHTVGTHLDRPQSCDSDNRSDLEDVSSSRLCTSGNIDEGDRDEPSATWTYHPHFHRPHPGMAAITAARQANRRDGRVRIARDTCQDLSTPSSYQGVTERGDASDVIGGLRTHAAANFVFTFALVYRTQKSGLSATGIAEYVPGNHSVFSAQTSSRHSSKARRNVKVADQGIVKAPLSSTVR
jgi:hypothetical protein